MNHSSGERNAPIIKQIEVRAVAGKPDVFESIKENHYLPSRSLSLFGGQVIAQAIMATYETVAKDLLIHSFHGSFIDRTNPALPVTYKVSRLRTGNTISPRLVQAFQNDKPLFTANMSFHKFEDKPVIKQNRPLQGFPKPEEMQPVKRSDYYQMIFQDGVKENDDVLLAALEVRHKMPETGQTIFEHDKKTRFSWGKGNVDAIQPIYQYLKVNGTLPDIPKYKAAAFGLASDAFSSQFPAVLIPHKDMAWMTSLDHVIYFHKPFDPTQWLAVENIVSVADGGRALVEMRYWNADGELVATALQEGLFRGKPKPKL